MKLTKRTMPETMYRASRCCRILGNPTAYLILRFVGEKRKTPSEIAAGLQMNLPTISATLRQLRNVDLMRYETRGMSRDYWVKDSGVLQTLDSLEKWVGVMRKKRL